MKIEVNEIYPIYNQGNNQETLFYNDKDYLEFLSIFRKVVYPHCSILAWCLMPNHFHFLISSTENSIKTRRIGNINSSELSNCFRLLQSQYAQYVNSKYNRSGSLFRQKAKAKSTGDETENYSYVAFLYIHQNPLLAGLVNRLEGWPYSSYTDYCSLRNGNLCNKKPAEHLMGFNSAVFMNESHKIIDDKSVVKIFGTRDLAYIKPK